MPTIPDTSWTTVSYAQVLQKNLQSPTALVPRTMRKQTAKGRKDSMEATTLWEDPTYRAKNLVSKATTLLQNDLRLGAVVFDFPTDEFADSAAAYECIQEQIGEALNKSVRPITKIGRDNEDRMVVEYMFANKENTKKAIEVGLNIKGIQYKGALVSNQSSDTKLTDITISQLQAKATDQEMIDGLRSSMRFFGNVVKIVKFTHRGWFEGNVKVTLDKAQVDDQVYEEMDRRLYLEDFQCAVVASWANAPAICFKCQRSGHLREKCPEMQKVTFFFV